MLLRCCLMHINIIILTELIIRLCLDLGLYISYVRDLFFIIIFVFIIIYHIISLKQTCFSFCTFLEMSNYVFHNIQIPNKNMGEKIN